MRVQPASPTMSPPMMRTRAIVSGVVMLAGMLGVAALSIFMARVPWLSGRSLAAFATGGGLGAAWLLFVLAMARRPAGEGASPPAGRNRQIIIGLIMPVGPFLGLMITTAVAEGSLLAGWMRWGFMILMMAPMLAGMGLIAASRVRRVGDSRHCPKCDYEYNFDDDDDAPIRCPECGTGWLGRLVIGRREGSRPMLIAGIAVLCSTALLFASLFGRTGFLARQAPTPVLISWAKLSPMTDRSAWSQLATRTLTPDQTASLAASVIARMASHHMTVGVEPIQWLESQIGTGALPAELEQRFFRQMFRHRGLHLPPRIKAGEVFIVGLRGTEARDGFMCKCLLYIAGFGVGDEQPVAGRSGEPYYPILADATRRHHADLPSGALAIRTPGRHVVRAELWVVVVNGPRPPITWNDDHTPNLPPGALYAERVVIEQEVDVAE